MKIVYTGNNRGGMFCPNVMNQVFYPGVAVDAPDKKETHRLLEQREDFELAPDDADVAPPTPPPGDEEFDEEYEDAAEAEPVLRGRSKRS